MTPDHARYEEWDAAYVLGALSPAERREFEAHLSGCERCRAAVAELASMPGLLARVSAPTAEALLGEAPSGSAELIRLVRHDDRRRSRRRLRVGVLVAAAAAVALAIVVPLALTAPAPPEAVAMQAVGRAPVSASLRLSSTDWGTRLELDCRYARGPGGGVDDASWSYGLFVTSRDHLTSQLSTWTISSGGRARLEAGTAIPLSDIATIEVRSLDDGTVVLTSQPG